MHCRFCSEVIRDGSILCDWCGKRQEDPPVHAEAIPAEGLAALQQGEHCLWFYKWVFLRTDRWLGTLYCLVAVNALGSAIYLYIRWWLANAARSPEVQNVFHPLAQNMFSRGLSLPLLVIQFLPIFAFLGLMTWRRWGWWIALISGIIWIQISALKMLGTVIIHPESALGFILEIAFETATIILLSRKRYYFE